MNLKDYANTLLSDEAEADSELLDYYYQKQADAEYRDWSASEGKDWQEVLGSLNNLI